MPPGPTDKMSVPPIGKLVGTSPATLVYIVVSRVSM